MEDLLHWVPGIAATVAVITLWLNTRKYRNERIEERATRQAVIDASIKAANDRIGTVEREVSEKIVASNNAAQIAVAKLDLLIDTLHKHEVHDASSFAELRVLVGESAKSQTGLENRMAASIEDIREQIRDMNELLRGVLTGKGTPK